MTKVMEKPICKSANCKKELTYLKESGCWRCLICNPLTKTAPTVEPERKYVDVKMTEERVREIVRDELMGCKFDEEQIRDIVRDELENWHIQKPPVTRDEIAEYPEVATAKAVDTAIENGVLETRKPEPLNWRQQAKALGIPLFQRKKADVLKEIEERTND